MHKEVLGADYNCSQIQYIFHDVLSVKHDSVFKCSKFVLETNNFKTAVNGMGEGRLS